MAPRKRPEPPVHGREVSKIRLPEDLAQWVEGKAKLEGRPQNRIIINSIATARDLEGLPNLMTLVGDMHNTLARYSARIVMHDLSDELLRAVDAVLKAEGGAVQSAIERLRVERTAMLKMKGESRS